MIPDWTILHRVGLAVCAVGGTSDTLDRAHACHFPPGFNPLCSKSQFRPTTGRSALLGMAATSVAPFAPIRSVTYEVFPIPVTASHLHYITHSLVEAVSSLCKVVAETAPR